MNSDYQMVENLNKLFGGFNIKAKCIDAKKHRHFAFYDVKLDYGTKVGSLTRYAQELAIAMKVKTGFIISPILEKGIVRLHTTCSFADILHFEDYYNKTKLPNNVMLPFLFGESVEGEPFCVDMSMNPHLLIGGSTGSGKSVLLHTLIANVAKRNDTKLYLIDTKTVEFGIYKDKDLRHIINYVANDYVSTLDVLNFIHSMMESRYKYMALHNICSIEQRPNLFDKVIVIIDEVADLMLYNKTKEFENLIVRLAQKARAAGIYLVLATQRPSVDVITGLIKSNFPARIACKVSTKTDSRIVLDQHGAESLAGRGDAIMKQTLGKSVRFQIAFSSSVDVVNNLKLRCN